MLAHQRFAVAAPVEGRAPQHRPHHHGRPVWVAFGQSSENKWRDAVIVEVVQHPLPVAVLAEHARVGERSLEAVKAGEVPQALGLVVDCCDGPGLHQDRWPI